MKYGDLRMMNHVNCSISNDAAFYQIIAISALRNECMLSGAREGEWIPLEKIKPIKITNELLCDLGFEFVGGGIGWAGYTKGVITLSVIPTTMNGLVLGYNIGKNYKYIRYIHELENLYYALTGIDI